MKLKMKFAILALLFFCGQAVFSQTKTIQGVVSDKSGLPLSGVSVKVQGESGEAVTDFDGKYSINAASNNKLVFTFIGMTSQVIAVGSNTSINITLKDASEDLKEVVVVAYGVQKRGNVTGAISTVSAKDIAALPITNAESALQGRAAGVTVINNGSPGSTPEVSIRGLGSPNNNSPLYVVDGVIVGNLTSISPNDIESVSVLKDASTAALYGSRGSNGVVIVTTKKGKSGVGQLSFNTYTGFQKVGKTYDLLNSQQYQQYAKDWGVTINRPADFLNNNVNYLDEIFTTGIMQDYNLNYSSGTDHSTNRFSAEYLNQDGVIVNSGYERYTFRANNTQKIEKLRLTVGSNMGISFGKQNPERISGGRTLIEHAIKAAPYLPVYNSTNLGGYQGPSNAADGQDAENPVRVQSLGYTINKTLGITGNIFAEFEIIKDLKFRSQVSLDYYDLDNRNFIPSYDDDNIPNGSTHSAAYSSTTRLYGSGQTIMFNNSLSYKKTIAEKHNFDAVILIENNKSKGEQVNAGSRYSISDEIDQLNSSTVTALNSSTFEDYRVGYVGRLNYNYDEKYLFAISGRRDASSRFGSNYRWANFYSVAGGWNIAKENFLQNTQVSTLKLRASYGTTGNDEIGRYGYSGSLVGNLIYPIGGNAAVGTTAGALASPDLHWESKTMKNIGLDFGFFNNKITGSFEIYDNRSNDLLLNLPVSPSIGSFSGSQPKNVGSVSTKGYEIVLGYNDNEGDFRWSANFNLGTSKNEVLDLGGIDKIAGGTAFRAGGDAISQTTVGDPLFYFYGLQADGIYKNQAEVDAVFTATPGQTTVKPGDIRFKDLNGDGNITSADRTKIGNPLPDFTYGMNFSATYKQFDFNFFITGVQGNDIFNTNRYDLEGMAKLFNAGTAVLDRSVVVNGVVTNPNSSIPRLNGAGQNTAVSSRFVEDGSYTRLKNISIGYTLPSDLSKYFSKLRIYASGQNLITITDYSGLDPEIGNGNAGIIGGTNYDKGIDRGNYPQPKSVLIGLEVSF
ncbi:TonB-linked SusC/RagA family outer membrane protein [Flavobacterium sp. 1]|uniref:SusC/RagA family TonB-linked outer membrane protein n=1 Tax=Flavobacterium sp. 1 TaxID=2035200 RepID=UPI000C23ECA6|nr:TonB-dependent receptor [Flavobacterium sp. 1]PJJ07662.1 TonB-linked SusC/RagA family outer membrane protein [Flavobacterium sp. 1]